MRLHRWSAQTDEELMRGVQLGERGALTQLYRRYSKKMVRYFYRMLWRDEMKAQDFLHDLFVKFIERPEHFDQTRKFSTWMYSVAVNMCKNEYRKQSFRKSTEEELLLKAEIQIDQPSPDDSEFQRKLEVVLRQSDEADRHLFTLRFELDLPVQEIAKLLECPEGTVKSRLFYFKRRLTDRLQVFNPAINQ